MTAPMAGGVRARRSKDPHRGTRARPGWKRDVGRGHGFPDFACGAGVECGCVRVIHVARSQLRPLTGFRFVAALQVLVFHCTRWPSWSGHPFARNIVASGYVAVSAFFVLSGFILTYVHAGRDARPLDRRAFYANRFARIYPAYGFALALIAPFFIVHTIRIDGVVVFLKGAVAVPTLVQAWVPSLAMAWNPPAWSLSVEAFFYLLFPLVAPSLIACRPSTAVSVAVTCYGACLVAPLVYLRLAPDGPAPVTHESMTFWLNALRYNPAVRFPEFVMGILLGRWYLEGRVQQVLGGGAPFWSALSAGALVLALAGAPDLPYPLVHNGLFAPSSPCSSRRWPSAAGRSRPSSGRAPWSRWGTRATRSTSCTCRCSSSGAKRSCISPAKGSVPARRPRARSSCARSSRRSSVIASSRGRYGSDCSSCFGDGAPPARLSHLVRGPEPR